jgi:hypothetical protein
MAGLTLGRRPGYAAQAVGPGADSPWQLHQPVSNGGKDLHGPIERQVHISACNPNMCMSRCTHTQTHNLPTEQTSVNLHLGLIKQEGTGGS